jgi:hypothetical protein
MSGKVSTKFLIDFQQMPMSYIKFINAFEVGNAFNVGHRHLLKLDEKLGANLAILSKDVWVGANSLNGMATRTLTNAVIFQ